MGLVVNATPRPLYPPGNRPSTHYTGCTVGLGACMEEYGKSRPTGIGYPGLSYSQIIS